MQNSARITAALLFASATASGADTHLTPRGSGIDASVVLLEASAAQKREDTRPILSRGTSMFRAASAPAPAWASYGSGDLAGDLSSGADLVRASVPEPSLKSLLVFGLIGLAAIRWRTRRRLAH